MRLAWRLIKEKRIVGAFTGEGARLYGGRWNQRGAPAVYVGENLSLSVLEQFVHLSIQEVNIRFAYIQIKIPDNQKIEEIIIDDLPKNWREEPPPDSTKQIGTEWLSSGRSAILRVPSVILPVEFNYLINPLHDDFKKIRIGKPQPFSFDPRMWK